MIYVTQVYNYVSGILGQPKTDSFFRVNFYPTQIRPETQNAPCKFILFRVGFRVVLNFATLIVFTEDKSCPPP